MLCRTLRYLVSNEIKWKFCTRSTMLYHGTVPPPSPIIPYGKFVLLCILLSRTVCKHNRRKFSRLGILLLNVCITNPSHLINRTLKLCALGTILFYQINFSKLFLGIKFMFLWRNIMLPTFEMRIYCLKCVQLYW